MRFWHGPSVIIHFVILICVVSQGRGETLPLAGAQRGVERIAKLREGVGVRSVTTLAPKQEEAARAPQRTLSNEMENVLLLLLGIILLLIFTATRLGFSKNDREPAKLDNLKN